MSFPGEHPPALEGITLSLLADDYPRWHCWRGVAGICYAKRCLTSPPALLRAPDAVELRRLIEGWEQDHKG